MFTKRKRLTLLKYCETCFAVVVLLACFMTMFWTITSSSQTKRTLQPVRRQDTLQYARDSFRQAMKTGEKKQEDDSFPSADQIIDPTDDRSDMFVEWFKPRKVQSYVTTKKHPIIKSPLIDNKDLCKNTTVHFLVYFHSLWRNFQRRRTLRETWASRNVFKDINIRILFVLGKPKEKEDQLKIINENLMNQDIIQGDFIDSFANITMKSILAVQWINDHCIHARYIIKADDDIFVNIFALIEYLVTQIHDKEKIIMCQVKENNTSPIVRNGKSQWYVPKNIFPQRTHFPTFCSGYMVLMTTDLIPGLYKASFDAPYFSVDDAYLFGMLMGQIKGVHYENIADALTLNQKSGLEEYKGNGPLVHVAINAWDNGFMEKFWSAALSRMSDWAKKHSSLAVVQRTIDSIMGKNSLN